MLAGGETDAAVGNEFVVCFPVTESVAGGWLGLVWEEEEEGVEELEGATLGMVVGELDEVLLEVVLACGEGALLAVLPPRTRR